MFTAIIVIECIFINIWLPCDCSHAVFQYNEGLLWSVKKAAEPVGETTIVCDAWPVRRQTYVSSLSWYSLRLPTKGCPG